MVGPSHRGGCLWTHIDHLFLNPSWYSTSPRAMTPPLHALRTRYHQPHPLLHLSPPQPLCCQLQWAPHKARTLVSVFVFTSLLSLPGLWIQEAGHYPLLVTEVPNATCYPCWGDPFLSSLSNSVIWALLPPALLFRQLWTSPLALPFSSQTVSLPIASLLIIHPCAVYHHTVASKPNEKRWHLLTGSEHAYSLVPLITVLTCLMTE